MKYEDLTNTEKCIFDVVTLPGIPVRDKLNLLDHYRPVTRPAADPLFVEGIQMIQDIDFILGPSLEEIFQK